MIEEKLNFDLGDELLKHVLDFFFGYFFESKDPSGFFMFRREHLAKSARC